MNIVPITKDNLDVLARALPKYGMPRSERWLRRCLYDPTVAESVKDPFRGHMAIDGKGEVVATQSYFYIPCYFRQEFLIATSSCLLGSDAGHTFDMMAVLAANNRSMKHGVLDISNSVSNATSGSISKVIKHREEPSCRSRTYCFAVSDIAAYPISILRHVCYPPPKFLERVAWGIMRPAQWVLNGIHSFAYERSEFDVVPCESFAGSRFDEFWDRFLAANDGLVSSRDPKRLQWQFSDALHSGKTRLIVAERQGRIYGYALLRGIEDEGSAAIYELVDICAVGNNVECLKQLARSSIEYAGKFGGIKVYFYGYMPFQELWLDNAFRFRRQLGYPTVLYGTKNPEIAESLEKCKGWFLGPFDGVRCVGHTRYYTDV